MYSRIGQQNAAAPREKLGSAFFKFLHGGKLGELNDLCCEALEGEAVIVEGK